MKSIAYVSRANTSLDSKKIPGGLSHIYSSSRKNNQRIGVSGMLSFRNGYYLQVIEGGDFEVNKLFARICSDDRHKDISVIFNTSISQRSFPKWSMKLITSTRDNCEFSCFIFRYFGDFNSLDPHIANLLSVFHDWPNQGKKLFPKGMFYEKRMSLKSWPDFTRLSPSCEVVELCARLSQSPLSYYELISLGLLKNSAEVNLILTRLFEMDLLDFASYDVGEITKISKLTRNRHSMVSNQFYRRMKTFLRFA